MENMVRRWRSEVRGGKACKSGVCDKARQRSHPQQEYEPSENDSPQHRTNTPNVGGREQTHDPNINYVLEGNIEGARSKGKIRQWRGKVKDDRCHGS